MVLFPRSYQCELMFVLYFPMKRYAKERIGHLDRTEKRKEIGITRGNGDASKSRALLPSRHFFDGNELDAVQQ